MSAIDASIIILRKIFAYDPTTRLPVSINYTLAADGSGGVSWVDPYSSLAAQSEVVGYLPTTISSINVVNSQQSTLIQQNFNTLSNAISLGVTPGGATTQQLISTSDYILNPSRYISSGNLISTQNYILGRSNDSSQQFISTVNGLGSSGYVSTSKLVAALTSTVAALGTVGYISTSQLTSTVTGLGSAGYVSTAQLSATLSNLLYTNTPTGYGVVTTAGTDPNRIDYFTLTASFLSTNQFFNSNTMTQLGYVNAQQLTPLFTSTVTGLGSAGYVSTQTLASTIDYLLRPITVNQLNNAYITNSVVGISSVMSGSFTSSMTYSGASGEIIGSDFGLAQFQSPGFAFSSLNLQLDRVSSLITGTSQVIVDYLPNWLFSPAVFPLGPDTAVVPIKTYLSRGTGGGQTFVYEHDTVLYAGASGTQKSNAFQQPIRMVFPGSYLLSNSFAQPYVLVHGVYGVSQGLSNGLYSSNVLITPPTNSYILTIQNLGF
jgi:hypothetical protein